VNKLKITIRSAFLYLQWSREFIQTNANATLTHTHTHTHTHTFVSGFWPAQVLVFSKPLRNYLKFLTHTLRRGWPAIKATSNSTHVLCVRQQVSSVSISALRMYKFSPDLRRPHLPSLPPPSCPSELLICVPQPSARTN